MNGSPRPLQVFMWTVKPMIVKCDSGSVFGFKKHSHQQYIPFGMTILLRRYWILWMIMEMITTMIWRVKAWLILVELSLWTLQIARAGWIITDVCISTSWAGRHGSIVQRCILSF